MKECKVEGCSSASFDKGLCQKHYTAIWRDGTLVNPVFKNQAPRKPIVKKEEVVELLRQAERRLEDARGAYNNAVGFNARMYWRTELTEIGKKIAALKEKL